MSDDPKPRDGYDFIEFIGIACHECLTPEDGRTPREATHKRVAAFRKTYIVEGVGPVHFNLAYVHETDEGFYIFATEDEKWTLPPSTREWLDTPLEIHLARAKKRLEQE